MVADHRLVVVGCGPVPVDLPVHPASDPPAVQKEEVQGHFIHRQLHRAELWLQNRLHMPELRAQLDERIKTPAGQTDECA